MFTVLMVVVFIHTYVRTDQTVLYTCDSSRATCTSVKFFFKKVELGMAETRVKRCHWSCELWPWLERKLWPS